MQWQLGGDATGCMVHVLLMWWQWFLVPFTARLLATVFAQVMHHPYVWRVGRQPRYLTATSALFALPLQDHASPVFMVVAFLAYSPSFPSLGQCAAMMGREKWGLVESGGHGVACEGEASIYEIEASPIVRLNNSCCWLGLSNHV
jgi:hypothetical protein